MAFGIIGRHRELAAIGELLDQAAAGTGGLLVLTGPAGSGRTALAGVAAGPGGGPWVPGHPAACRAGAIRERFPGGARSGRVARPRWPHATGEPARVAGQ